MKIRVGVLLDGYTIPQWAARMLERIATENEVVLVVVNGSPQPPRSMRQRLSTGLYSIWRKLDQRLFPAANDAFATADVRQLLEGAAELRVNPERARFSDRITKHDVERIRSHRPDVLIRLGFRILCGDILNASSAGVWSLHHGDNAVSRGGPAGVWEVLRGEPTTGAILQILTEDMDGGIVLSRTWSATDTISVNRNLQGLYWKSAALIPRQLRRLKALGVERFIAEARERQSPDFYTFPLHKLPTNRQMVPLLACYVWRNVVRQVAQRLWHEQWLILAGSGPAYRFKAIRPPADRFWADPCAVTFRGKDAVFIKEMPSGGKGHIAVLNDGTAITVLDRPYHLSYPFLVEEDGELYMIPESAANRTIELYRCTEFPARWEFEMNLMEGVRAVDTTVLKHGTKWWLFAGLSEAPAVSCSDELFLFSSATLLSSKWSPHPLNPIVSDVRRARPAGRIFTHNGKLYRPAQDCGGSYGSAIRLNRIDRLTDDDYAETEVGAFEPRWNPRITKLHTLSLLGHTTYIDGTERRLKLAGVFQRKKLIS